MKVTLTRSYTPWGVIGDLTVGDTSLKTLERPWEGNQINVSCIPEGTYLCVKYSSSRYPNTWEITCVVNRTKILFHVGNKIDDSSGCVLVGMNHTIHDGQLWLGNSREGMDRFRSELGNYEEFELTVKKA